MNWTCHWLFLQDNYEGSRNLVCHSSQLGLFDYTKILLKMLVTLPFAASLVSRQTWMRLLRQSVWDGSAAGSFTNFRKRLCPFLSFFSRGWGWGWSECCGKNFRTTASDSSGNTGARTNWFAHTCASLNGRIEAIADKLWQPICAPEKNEHNFPNIKHVNQPEICGLPWSVAKQTRATQGSEPQCSSCSLYWYTHDTSLRRDLFEQLFL